MILVLSAAGPSSEPEIPRSLSLLCAAVKMCVASLTEGVRFYIGPAAL